MDRPTGLLLVSACEMLAAMIVEKVSVENPLRAIFSLNTFAEHLCRPIGGKAAILETPLAARRRRSPSPPLAAGFVGFEATALAGFARCAAG